MLHLLKNNLILVLFLLLCAVPVYAANIDSTEKYAWSSEGGWVNMNPTNGGVAVSDSALTGYAWAQNTGWISFDTTQSGVTNDGNGTLGGFAWSEGEGWLSFTGVTIDSSGYFSGTATGASSTITFSCTNCSVRTSWSPTSSGSGSSGGSSGGGSSNSSESNETGDTASSTQNETRFPSATPTFPVGTPEQEMPFDNNKENETGTTSSLAPSSPDTAVDNSDDDVIPGPTESQSEDNRDVFNVAPNLLWLIPGIFLLIIVLLLYRRFSNSS